MLVSSATLDAMHFRDYFDAGPGAGGPGRVGIMTVKQERLFPVDLFYSVNPVADYVREVIGNQPKHWGSNPAMSYS